MQKTMMRWLSLCFLIGFGVMACQTTSRLEYCTTEIVDRREFDAKRSRLEKRKMAREPLQFAPDTAYLAHFPLRYVRLNIHFVNASDSSKNYVGEEGIKFAKNLVANANHDLEHNQPMRLPLNNETPCLPPRYRLQITGDPNDPTDDGIYFHFDNEVCYYVHRGKNRNIHKREVINRYAVQKDSVLNVFIMPHHPDSVASSTYAATGVGVALGSNIKMAGMYEGGKPFWHYRQILNHEVGHVFGLQHAWTSSDGCNDTPQHANCWNYTKEPPCDTLVSNNVMDYNSNQNSWTPCQIGRIHRMMATEKARQRKLLMPTWCELNPNYNISITDSVHWQVPKDIEGHITIEKGGILVVSNRVSLPATAKITIRIGGKLILDEARLHNACGDQWDGIVIESNKKARGQLVISEKTKLEDMLHPLE